MSRGSEEALTHLRGLKSIVKVRGGVEQLEMGTLSTMLQTLDVLHAVLFDCQPVLVKATTDTDMFASTEDIDPDPDGLPKMFASILMEQVFFQTSGPQAHVDVLRPLHAIIREAGSLLRDEVSDTTAFTPGSIGRYHEALEYFYQRTRLEDTPADAFELVRCAYSMALIHFNSIADKIPFRHAANQANADGLFDAICRVKNQTWEELPYLRLLMLLTGAASTTSARTKSFFKAETVRAIYQMGEEEMPRVKLFILRFIKMRDVLQREGRLATPAVNAHVTSDFLTPGRQQDYFGAYDQRPVTAIRSASWSGVMYPSQQITAALGELGPFTSDPSC